LKKIIFILPILFFFGFVTWGFIYINEQNTKVFSEISKKNEKVDYEKLKAELGMDFKYFIKDNSEIKIHQTENDLYLEYKEYEIDLNNSIFKPIIINFVGGVEYILSQIGNGIGSGIEKIEDIF
jgi:hypothetical protein